MSFIASRLSVIAPAETMEMAARAASVCKTSIKSGVKVSVVIVRTPF